VPLLPIDLQTLFTQIPQVGKEQAAQKDATPLAQSLQGAQMVRKNEQKDNAVNETQPPDRGPEQVKQKTRREGERKGRGRDARRPAPQDPKKRDVFRDPDLGRNIDITS